MTREFSQKESPVSWKEMSVMEQKEEFILLWKTGKYTITSLAEMFNISRTTAHKYIERYEKYGLPGLLELSRAPGKVPNKTRIELKKRL